MSRTDNSKDGATVVILARNSPPGLYPQLYTIVPNYSGHYGNYGALKQVPKIH